MPGAQRNSRVCARPDEAQSAVQPPSTTSAAPVISADASARHQSVVTVMEAARRAERQHETGSAGGNSERLAAHLESRWQRRRTRARGKGRHHDGADRCKESSGRPPREDFQQNGHRAEQMQRHDGQDADNENSQCLEELHPEFQDDTDQQGGHRKRGEPEREMNDGGHQVVDDLECSHES